MENKEIKKSWVKVKCHECGNEQDIFGRASTQAKCTKCEEVLAMPTGGKAAIKAEILELH
jgi:small subunit ribosomal protein S27e